MFALLTHHDTVRYATRSVDENIHTIFELFTALGIVGLYQRGPIVRQTSISWPRVIDLWLFNCLSSSIHSWVIAHFLSELMTCQAINLEMARLVTLIVWIFCNILYFSRHGTDRQTDRWGATLIVSTLMERTCYLSFGV